MSNQSFKIGDTVYINYKSTISSSYDIKDVPAKVLGVGKYSENEPCLSLEYFSKEKNSTIIEIFHSDWVSKGSEQKTEEKPNNQTMKTQEQINTEIKELEDKIASLKKEKESQSFEVGDWFFTKLEAHDKSYVFGKLYEIVKINEREHDSSVFVVRFNEHCTNSNFDSRYARKATKEEIEAHLIKLAEESGLKVGDPIPNNKDINIEKFEIYTKDSNFLSSNCRKYLTDNKLKYGLRMVRYGYAYAFDYIAYQRSKLQPKITINNYDAEFCVGYVKFGYAKFNNLIFQKTKELIDLAKDQTIWGESNRTITNIKIGEGIFTPTDIDNIVKRLKP